MENGAQQSPALRQKASSQELAHETLGHASELHGKVAWTPIHVPSCTQVLLSTHNGLLGTNFGQTENKERTWARLTDQLAWNVCCLPSDFCSTVASLSNGSEGLVVRGEPHRGQSSEQRTWLFTSHEGSLQRESWSTTDDPTGWPRAGPEPDCDIADREYAGKSTCLYLRGLCASS